MPVPSWHAYISNNFCGGLLGGQEITGVSRNSWIVDFGTNRSLEEAAEYALPYQHVLNNVKPIRDSNNRSRMRLKWWLHGETRPGLRRALNPLSRYIATPEVAKHRIFVWVAKQVLPDHTLHVIARDDDYFFGVLHSLIHQTWSLRIGSWMGKGNDPRYTSTRTFETFPFPWPPGAEVTDSPLHAAISAAAQALHAERDAWLKAARDRTLTDLYNALNVLRGREAIRTSQAAGDFAPRLDALHTALDAAVCDAYGWPREVLADDEALLARLLALNLARAGGISPVTVD